MWGWQMNIYYAHISVCCLPNHVLGAYEIDQTPSENKRTDTAEFFGPMRLCDGCLAICVEHTERIQCMLYNAQDLKSPKNSYSFGHYSFCVPDQTIPTTMVNWLSEIWTVHSKICSMCKCNHRTCGMRHARVHFCIGHSIFRDST